MSELVSYDLDTGSEQLLCESDDPWVSWSVTSCLMSTRGHLVYVGLCAENGHSGDRVHVLNFSMHILELTSSSRRKLLEFQADDDSGHLSGPITFDVPMSCTGREACLHVKSGDTPFVLISVVPLRAWGTTLIFDTRSQIFYRFPELRCDPDTEGVILGVPGQEIVLTMTHIILSRIGSSPSDPFQLVQA
ncbi:hypothetical protein OG21DRAFT_1489028 [Imleria badia]|nr:hypothetical protein OG21DRAFT_1489028 [Imleria badia]